MRPDVHAGDRPSGASFATRSPALGLNGAAGTAHPLATQTAIAMLKRGGSAVDAAVAANAVLGFVEPVSSGLGGDCFAFVWDPKVGKLAGMASSGRSPKALTLATARARAVEWRDFPRWAPIAVSTPGRARRMVDAAPALRKAQMGGVVRARNLRLRKRRSHAADHRLLHQAQYGGVSAAQLGRGRNGQCGGDLHRRGA